MICDGTYERVEQYEFVIDQKCEDISLKIDGSFANNVKELLLSDTAQFETNCIEGKVYYKLYKDDEMIEEGQSQVVEISSDQQIDTIEFYAVDQYGHKSSKIVHIQYPTILEVKPLQEAVEDKIVQKEDKKEVAADPKNHEELCQIIREELEYKGVSVIIPRRVCIQKAARDAKKKK